MGDDAPSGHVGLTLLNRLQNVQVIQHILYAAVVGQSIEERSDCLLCPHCYSPCLACQRPRFVFAFLVPKTRRRGTPSLFATCSTVGTGAVITVRRVCCCMLREYVPPRHAVNVNDEIQ